MGSVILWPQAVTVIAAARRQHAFQPWLRFCRLPAVLYRDPLTVCQPKRRDIQRLCRSMFTASRVGAMVNVAAGKAAEMLNTRQLTSRIASGEWPGLLADKQGRTERQRAARKETAVQADRTEVTYPDDVTEWTLPTAVCDRLCADKRALIGLR